MIKLRNKKIVLKSTALLLAVVMLFSSVSLNVFAQDVFVSTEVSEQEPYIVEELTEYRNENTKLYLKSDGTMTAVQSSGSLHFQDDEGKWQEIDNRLEKTNENGVEYYENNAGDITFKLPVEISPDNAVEISKDGYEISFKKLGVFKKSSSKKENGKEKSNKKQMAEKSASELCEEQYLNSEVVYGGAYTNSDVKYNITPSGLKESIIINKKPNKNVEYKYLITASGLKAKLNDDNSVDFFVENTENPLFVMPAPFMFDADNKVSYDIDVTLVPSGDDYLLTLKPNNSWLKSKDRVYPVTIDPTVEGNSNGKVQIAWTSEFDSYNRRGNTNFIVGNVTGEGWDGECVSYIWIKDVIGLPKGSSIISAKLKLPMTLHGNTGSGLVVAAKQIKENWDETTLTPLNVPEVFDTVLDYMSVTSSDDEISLDLTALYYNWLNSSPIPNCGVQVSQLYDTYCYASCTGYNNNNGPYMEFDIVNQNGMANSSSSRKVSVGRAGDIALNDYTGNLNLIRNDISAEGNNMPVQFQMVYNTYEKDSVVIGFGDNPAYGYGWRSNYSQTIKYVTPKVGNPYYEYVTADGSVTYFEKVLEDSEITSSTDRSEIFKDVTNGKYIIHVGSNYSNYTSVYIKGESNERYYFDNFGRLVKIAGNMEKTDAVTATSTGDELGVIKINYVSNANASALAISSIVDGAGRKYNFVYNDDKMLWVIQYLGKGTTPLSTVTYTYYDDKTVKLVSWNDGLNATYHWSDKCLVDAMDSDLHKFKFEYDTFGPIPTVSVIKEYGTDGTILQHVTVSRGINFVQYKNVDSQNYETVNFDYRGNAMNVSASNSSDEMVVGYYEKPSLGSQGNQLVFYSSVQKIVGNLIKNSYATDGMNNWTKTGDGSTTVTTEYKKYGANSFKLQSNNEIAIYQDVSRLISDTTYTLSAYVKTTNGSWAELEVETLSGELSDLKTSAALVSSNVEQRMFLTFTAKEMSNVRIKLKGSGVVYFDGIQLEKGENPGRFNLVNNSEFSSSDNWHYDNSKASIVADRIQFTGDVLSTNEAWQDISVSGEAGDEYTFGISSYKRNATPSRDYDAKLQFYKNGQKVGEESYILLPHGASENRFGITTAVAEGDYDKIRITLCYNYALNSIMVYNAQLHKGGISDEYLYDNDGNATGSVDVPDNPSGSDSDNETDQTESKDITPLEFDSHNRIIKSEDLSGVKSYVGYDAFSNPLYHYITDGSIKIEKRTAYSEDGNYKLYETDEFGNKITYNTNENTGKINSVTDAEGNVTNYTYDSSLRLKKAETPVTGLTDGTSLVKNYTYDNGDRLTSLNDYTASYTNGGRLSKISVNSQDIISYNYNDKSQNSTLSSIHYGNDQSLYYTYDSKDRLSKISDGQNDLYGYTYGIDGNVIIKNDFKNNVITKFSKDGDGNDVIRNYSYNYNNSDQSYYYSYLSEYTKTYDSLYEKMKIDTDFFISKTTNFDYTTNGNIASVKWNAENDAYEFNYSYDDLGRVKSNSAIKSSGGSNTSLFSTTFAYTDLPQNKSTNQVFAINHYAKNYSRVIPYEYYKNGLIKKSGDVTYEYDEAGQLTRVNDPAEGTTVYVYNSRGNIEEVKTYAYTVGELGEVLSTRDYVYGSTTNKDLLTEYNGSPITYDEIGNPISYKDKQLLWQNGNQLKGVSYNNSGVSFKYNSDGLRTEKYYSSDPIYALTIGTYYTYADGKLTLEVNKRHGSFFSYYMYFRYNDSGELIGFDYKDELSDVEYQYYYLKNLQGDIIGIVNSSGEVVVEYKYDAFGKLIDYKYTDSKAANNPFRYRGYYYDNETGFYYLQTRYYDPETGRFINADNPNMIMNGELPYSYCGNNPVNNSDPSGTTYLFEIYNTYDWIDTLLHMGLSPGQSTMGQFIYAYVNNIGGDIFKDSIDAFYNEQYKHFFNYGNMSEFAHYFRLPTAPMTAFIRATENFFYNAGLQMETDKITNLIYNQHDPYIDKFRFGSAESASQSTCGAIAIYNALVLLGKHVNFAELLYILEITNSLIFGGQGGVIPNSVEKIADLYGMTYDYTTDITDLNSWRASKDGVIILTYFNNKNDVFKGLHTVAARLNDNKVVTYNRSYYAESEEYFNNFTEVVNNGELLCAYYLYDF